MFSQRFFTGKVAVEATVISKTERRYLVSLNAMQKSIEFLLKEIDGDRYTLARNFWAAIIAHHPDWRLAAKLDDGALLAEKRDSRISFHAIALNAYGMLGNTLIRTGEDWQTLLTQLDQVNWRRDNPDWEGLICLGGNIVKTKENARKLAEYIYQKIKADG